MSQKRYACAWCNEKDKKGGYVTVKGYSSTMKHTMQSVRSILRCFILWLLMD